MKTTEELKVARDEKLKHVLALADFARLENPEQARAFEQSNPEFFPNTWWDWGRAALPLPLRNTEPGFDWSRYQQLLREAWKTRFPLDTTVQLSAPSSSLQMGDLLMFRKVYPYQRAVMLMHAEPWRAAHCEKCARPFAKDAKGRRFCSRECYDPALEAKRRWWHKKGSLLRAKRNKAKKNRMRK